MPTHSKLPLFLLNFSPIVVPLYSVLYSTLGTTLGTCCIVMVVSVQRYSAEYISRYLVLGCLTLGCGSGGPCSKAPTSVRSYRCRLQQRIVRNMNRFKSNWCWWTNLGVVVSYYDCGPGGEIATMGIGCVELFSVLSVARF